MKNKILIVEDELILAQDVKRKLEGFGYDVVGIAFSGYDALLLVQDLKPDLMLVDITLQGHMDGIEVAKRIKDEHHIPIVFVTGNTDTNTRERALGIDPEGYLGKPVDVEVLRETIERVLN